MGFFDIAEILECRDVFRDRQQYRTLPGEQACYSWSYKNGLEPGMCDAFVNDPFS